MNELAPIYQFDRWEQNFENSKSQGYKKAQVVCVSNDVSSHALTNILGEPDGMAVFGMYNFLVMQCSRQTCGEYYKDENGVKRFKSARAGWITADGTETGRPLSATELAFISRRPVAEVHRCFEVLTSPCVALLKLVKGMPEYEGDQRSPNTLRTDFGSAVPDFGSAVPDAKAESSHEIRECGRVTAAVEQNRTERGTERERKKESPIIPLKGDETVSSNGCQQSRADTMHYPEAVIWLNSLFPGCKKFLDQEEMQLLNEILPLPRKSADLMSCAYGLSRAPDGCAAYDGPDGAKVRLQPNRLALLREFSSEIERWTDIKTIDSARNRRRSLGEPKENAA